MLLPIHTARCLRQLLRIFQFCVPGNDATDMRNSPAAIPSRLASSSDMEASSDTTLPKWRDVHYGINEQARALHLCSRSSITAARASVTQVCSFPLRCSHLLLESGPKSRHHSSHENQAAANVETLKAPERHQATCRNNEGLGTMILRTNLN